ncbi:MAG: hypothetical protein MR707_09220 [Galactobacillus timonensis]|uniref:hypothetical protein n=1 Tax=Galactobacillus timonensis TaxID=2041840 RepID=UPI0023F1E804|nr:hypothetical protein [Galactobacillus timonensis]MCI6068381.1 hypothetical protein [Galactobacillus timonensis]
MEEEPINTVIAMLKDAREEIGGLISDYESGRIPSQELVAETFEIGKMFIGWSDEMSDEEALKLIMNENRQIQKYLKKRRMQS